MQVVDMNNDFIRGYKYLSPSYTGDYNGDKINFLYYPNTSITIRNWFIRSIALYIPEFILVLILKKIIPDFLENKLCNLLIICPFIISFLISFSTFLMRKNKLYKLLNKKFSFAVFFKSTCWNSIVDYSNERACVFINNFTALPDGSITFTLKPSTATQIETSKNSFVYYQTKESSEETVYICKYEYIQKLKDGKLRKLLANEIAQFKQI